MLETEADEDFFTPVAGATLATIFGSQPKSNEGPGNDTLKYTPPKPQSTANNHTKKQDTKATECLLADTVTAHEWHENEYKSRGTLGLAIIKYLKLELCRIILYDSEKTTLSHTTISQTSEFTVKNNSHISFYDDEQKYWSVYAKENKVSLISDCLKKCGANIKHSTDADNAPSVSDPADILDVSEKKEVQNVIKDVESDTDSSVNRRTKAAIIQRMAHMGHSVLPSKSMPVDKTSDSSDNADAQSQPKPVRHKPVKPNYKKLYDTDSSTVQTESRNSNESIQMITPQTVNNQINPSNFGQLMPVTTSFINTSNNELGLLMSEQRIGNSELRINMNRITDKVDLVLEKISHLHPQNAQQNINTDILMKLLAQYESKIKFYEELLQVKSNKNTGDTIPSVSNQNIEIEELRRKISDLEQENVKKSSELTYLNSEIKKLKSESDEKQIYNEQLLEKSQALSLDIQSKNEELEKLREQQSISISASTDDTVSAKIKSVMNELFHTISANFIDEENYTGSDVKKLTGALIKRTTIRSLQDIQQHT